MTLRVLNRKRNDEEKRGSVYKVGSHGEDCFVLLFQNSRSMDRNAHWIGMPETWNNHSTELQKVEI